MKFMMKATRNGVSRIAGKNGLAAFLIFLVCVLAYHNSLRNEFLIDDYALMLGDPQFQNIKYLPHHLIPDLNRHLQVGPQGQDTYYRPVAHIVPAVYFWAFGEDPFGYHVANLVLFWCTCLAIFFLCARLSGDSLTAFLAAVLYAIHPLNGLYVNYTTASVFAIQVTALSLSMLLFLRALQEQKGALRKFAFSILLFITALLCHETSLAFPFLLGAVAWLGEKQPAKRVLKATLGYFAAAAGYFVFRLFFSSLKSSVLDKAFSFEVGPWEQIASLAKVTGWYASRLIYPEGIVLIWSTPPVQHHVLWINLLFLLSVAGSFIVIWKYRNKNPVLTVGMLFLLVGGSPVLLGALFKPFSGFIIEPHWMFFPSVGFFLMLAAGLRRLSMEHRALFVCMTFLIVVPWLILTWRMNRIWSTELSYISYWVKQVPHDKDIRFHLGHVYHVKGDFERAERYYLESMIPGLNHGTAYNNLGTIAVEKKDWKKAEEYFKKALEASPRMAKVHSNLGVVYRQRGNAALAEEHYKLAIQYNPYLTAVKINLASLYEGQGRWAEAEALYKENLEDNSGDALALFRLAELYFRNGNKEQAAGFAEDFLKVSDNAELLTQLGVRCAQNGLARQAVALLKKAVELDRGYQPAYIELGKVFANYEEWKKAYLVWETGARETGEGAVFEGLIARARKIERAIKESDAK